MQEPIAAVQNPLPVPRQSDSPRVLMVTPRYFPYMGGVENHVYEVARRLAVLGARITVLTTDPSNKLPQEEISEGVQIKRVKAWPANRDYYFAPDIYREIHAAEWDIVHLQSYHTMVAPLTMVAARNTRLPYVVTFHAGGHSSPLRNALRGVQQTMLRPLLSRANRLVAIAEFEIEAWSKRLGVPANRFALIPNGADLPPIAVTIRKANPGQVLIASIGRLERYKGHHRILAALPNILVHFPNARLWIAGVGPYESELRNLAERLGVSDHVEIRSIPISERSEMAEQVSQADLVVLLSEYETHPIAILEAIALGRPALVSATSGLKEIANKGLATAIPLNRSPEQIAESVVERLRRPILPPPFTLPTWDDCATKLLALYQQVIRESSCVS